MSIPGIASTLDYCVGPPIHHDRCRLARISKHPAVRAISAIMVMSVSDCSYSSPICTPLSDVLVFRFPSCDAVLYKAFAAIKPTGLERSYFLVNCTPSPDKILLSKSMSWPPLLDPMSVFRVFVKAQSHVQCLDLGPAADQHNYALRVGRHCSRFALAISFSMILLVSNCSTRLQEELSTFMRPAVSEALSFSAVCRNLSRNPEAREASQADVRLAVKNH